MDIALVKHPGYLHVQPFEEVVESVKWGLEQLEQLEQLGMLGPTLENQIRPQVPTILFGANLLSSEQIRALLDSVIPYNLEQLDPSSPWFPSERFHALSKRSMLWDYSLSNLSVWKASGLRKVVHLPNRLRSGSNPSGALLPRYRSPILWINRPEKNSAGAVEYASDEHFVATCRRLVKAEDELAKMSKNGFEWFRRRNITKIRKQAIAESYPVVP
ncbi:MAG: hypothetical protein M1600_08005 [Firmicutes bacterium]|nr:hypothetical protein [Bacillota bacterium]